MQGTYSWLPTGLEKREDIFQSGNFDKSGKVRKSGNHDIVFILRTVPVLHIRYMRKIILYQ